jgi:hypothetical protein
MDTFAAINFYICRESRYLLVLTENYAALRLLQGQFHNHDPVVIFGSSFPKDQQYTQVNFLQFLFICMLLLEFKCPTFNRLLLLENVGLDVMYINEFFVKS